MGIITNIRERLAPVGFSYPEVALEQVLATRDIIEVTPNAIICRATNDIVPINQPGNTTMQFDEPSYSEIGSSGNTIWGNYILQDYNPKLRGLQGLRTYEEMRKSNGQVRLSLKVVKTPILAAHWYIEPATQGKRDKKIATEIWDNLTKKMSMSWPQFLTELLYHLDFGWYAFEKVFTKGPDGKVIWQKFAPRHPLEALQFRYDSNGGPNSAVFYGPDMREVEIPIEKLLVFTNEKEGGNMTGVSVMRPAYQHWYFVQNFYKIDAIAKERHGVGIPLIQLPPGFTKEDRAAADQLGRNLRANEKAHIVAPPYWDISFVKLEGHSVDIIKSVEHHNSMILNSVLGGFLEHSADSPEKVNLYMKGTRFIADQIRDVINKWAIPELVAYNYGSNVEPPTLRARRIGDTTDWRTMSFAIRNLIGAGALRVDIPLLDWIREELDLPQEDEDSLLQSLEPVASRVVVPEVPGAKGEAPNPGIQPPAPPAVGLPRQTPAKPSNGAGSGRVGRDGSGG